MDTPQIIGIAVGVGALAILILLIFIKAICRTSDRLAQSETKGIEVI